MDDTSGIQIIDQQTLDSMELICQLCYQPITNLHQHFSPVLLSCPSICKYETYCYEAMKRHRENQYKSSYDNLFIDSSIEISNFDDITEEHVKQVTEKIKSYSLNDETLNINTTLPDDESPNYCKTCCQIFPSMKDAGKVD